MQLAKDDRIKEDVLKEARKLFQQYGLKKTTMEDIARAIGKGKSTLYYYYANKEEIFDAVIMKEMQEVFNSVKLAVEKAETAEEKLKEFSITKIKSVQKKGNLYKMVRGDLQENLYCTRHLHNQYDAEEVGLVKSILEFGIKNGEFAKAIRKDLDLLPSVIVSSLRGLERDLFMDNRFARIGPRLESIMGILIRGLSNS